MYRCAVAACMVLCSLAAAQTQAQEEQERKLVVCSTTQVADFARQIAGDRCRVECVLAAGADPHLYEPKTGDAQMVAKADLCLENGMHLEGKDWMRTLANDAGKRIVACTDGVKPLRLEEDGKLVNDPHCWFSPKNAAVYVNNIARALIEMDPEGTAQYKARTQLYLEQLKALHFWTFKQLSAVPTNRRILVTSHDAFEYFCHEYEWQTKTPVGWSTGSEVGGGVTPQRRKQVVESIRKFAVPAIFVETSVNKKLIREIANEAGVKIGGELYSDSMGAPGTAGESYIGMMRENVITIVGALK